MKYKNIIDRIGDCFGNSISSNSQNATNTSIEGMNLFRKVAYQKHNVDFEKVKGNLFEYIEAAKFNVDSAQKGKNIKAIVTDAVGRPHDSADIEIVESNKVLKQVQAKFSTSKKAASDSVNMHRKSKYKGMDRLIRKDNNYVDESTGNTTTLLKRTKELANKRASVEGGVFQEEYKDVAQNLTDELKYENITSGGTTLEDIKKAHRNPVKYEKNFIKKQVNKEIKSTSKNMAVANMISTGMISSITNIFKVFNDEIELSDAIGKVGGDVGKSGIRGGATGALSATIRTSAVKTGNQFFSDPMASTVIAGGILDGGIALYSYAKGDIDEQQLKDELVDTTIKSTATIYYTKAIGAMAGNSVNPFIPMAVYTAASFIVTNTREIIRNANLSAEESAKLTAILEESARLAKEKHNEFREYIEVCESNQKKMLDQFIETFEYNFENGLNYDIAIASITKFAEQAGIALQHVKFEDFSNTMKKKQTLRLK